MTAVLDPTRTYRYRLEREVGPEARTVLFVMLNPSTADETTDDATIRRCIAFARRERCGHLIVCNLYALRTTDPRELGKALDPIGPHNEDHLRRAAGEAHLIVAAWGSNYLSRSWTTTVWAILTEANGGYPLRALRITKTGDPGHPLYLPANAPLVEWEPTP